MAGDAQNMDQAIKEQTAAFADQLIEGPVVNDQQEQPAEDVQPAEATTSILPKKKKKKKKKVNIIENEPGPQEQELINQLQEVQDNPPQTTEIPQKVAEKIEFDTDLNRF